MIGLIVLLVGVLFLLHNLGLIPAITWGIVWPVIIILIGISMMEKRYWWSRGGWRYWRDCKRQKEERNDQNEKQ